MGHIISQSAILIALGATFLTGCNLPNPVPQQEGLDANNSAPLLIRKTGTESLAEPAGSSSATAPLPSSVIPVGPSPVPTPLPSIYLPEASTPSDVMPVVEFFGQERMVSGNMIGETVAARWLVSGVNAVEVQILYPDQTMAAVYPDQPPAGSVSFPLTEDLRRFGLPAELTFRLVLPGFGELDQFVVQVVAPVGDAAEAISFTAEPAEAHPGDSVTLRWEVTGAERITIAATDPGNFPFANLTDLPPSGSAVIVIPLDIRPTTGWPAAVSFGMWVTQPTDGRMLIGNSSTFVLVNPSE